MSELLEQMKLLNEDHKPDGWPAVRMSEINALVSMIKSHGEQLAKANERIAELEQSKHKESLETISDYILEFMQANGIENFSTNRLSTNEGRQIELTIRYVDGETPADQLEKARQRIDELESQMQLTALTTHEASFESDYGKKRLNKFALEQKCQCVSALNTYFVNRANRENEMLPIYFPDWCNDFREQLRKEQSND